MSYGDLLLTDGNRVLLADGISLLLLSNGQITHRPRIVLAATYLYDSSGNFLTDSLGNPLTTSNGGWLQLANATDFVLLVIPPEPVLTLYQLIYVG